MLSHVLNVIVNCNTMTAVAGCVTTDDIKILWPLVMHITIITYGTSWRYWIKCAYREWNYTFLANVIVVCVCEATNQGTKFMHRKYKRKQKIHENLQVKALVITCLPFNSVYVHGGRQSFNENASCCTSERISQTITATYRDGIDTTLQWCFLHIDYVQLTHYYEHTTAWNCTCFHLPLYHNLALDHVNGKRSDFLQWKIHLNHILMFLFVRNEKIIHQKFHHSFLFENLIHVWANLSRIRCPVCSAQV